MPLLTRAFGLRRRRWSSPQQCYLHCLRTVTNVIPTELSRHRQVMQPSAHWGLQSQGSWIPGISGRKNNPVESTAVTDRQTNTHTGNGTSVTVGCILCLAQQCGNNAIQRVVVLPIRHKNRSFWRRSPSQSLGLISKQPNLTQQKHAFTNQKKYTKNKHKTLKPGLDAFYDIRPWNGAGLFSKEKLSQGGDK